MTRILPATHATITQAADLLRSGGLVAMPTETVYGLGARALDPTAVARVYAAKQRPPTSPVIAHVESIDQARSLLREWPQAAQRLAQAFWPGPLTLVLPKADHVPDVLTGGGPRLGVRLPSHPVALALIRALGEPIAAPSANRFMQLSPTRAEHVEHSLGDAVDLILDGGDCAYGIESTVVRIEPDGATLLRHGAIPAALLEQVLGAALKHPPRPSNASGAVQDSPGQHQRHYAPRTPLFLWQRGQALPPGRGGMLALGEPPVQVQAKVRMPKEAAAYAQRLYSELHTLDGASLDWIAVEAPPSDPAWAAVHDRLQRATYVD
ncbi:L-threonylcarbamoyladenylate synthase [Aquimonas voraii]|uniref:Threonylcarbamoyl-AMP synthase n=1 Tax=Aquimonas voraii TaxID=265719 RepID=A0A1G6SY03_9GAMM|nr:L-threonylcarbamoyladenylate synthase [Aquimonas voraii]SDD21678.1 translation factor SUA5 [Aquimonas voraii]